MGIRVLLILAVLGVAASAPAPWRCFKLCGGGTVCFPDKQCPTFCPPTICVPRPCPPCSGQATVFLPGCLPQDPCPDPIPPCPCPCPDVTPYPCPTAPTTPPCW